MRFCREHRGKLGAAIRSDLMPRDAELAAAQFVHAHCIDPTCEVTRQTFENWIPAVAAYMRSEYERLKAEAA